MTSHDDAARDTANARGDAAAALGVRLKAMTAERDELAAKVARVEALLPQWSAALTKLRAYDRYRMAVYAARADLAAALRGNP